MNFSDMLADLLTAQGLIQLLTLSLLEVVLGVDNIIFIAIIADKLPSNQRGQARTTGLMLAVLIRIALLFTLSFLSS
ncbi:MAG TPA: TerC family protein, partial [Bacteroidia bacterium]|nr:TerC family protein [Bacteroidia bacterium]